MINLTEQEREKFATYLEQEAATTDGMIEQCKKLPSMEPSIKHFNVQSMSMKIVARILRKTETVTL